MEEEVLPFPDNPNGADANVAGVCDAIGTRLWFDAASRATYRSDAASLLDASQPSSQNMATAWPCFERRRLVRVGSGFLPSRAKLRRYRFRCTLQTSFSHDLPANL